MVFKPAKGQGLFMGLFLGAVFFATIIMGANFSLVNEPRLRLLILIPAYLLLLGYIILLLGLISMKYIVTDEGITVVWLFKRFSVKWEEVTEVVKAYGRVNLINYMGISWPGYVVGMYLLGGVGIGKVFGTGTKELLVFKTDHGNLSISPCKGLLDKVYEKSGKVIVNLDLYDLTDDEIGRVIGEDLPYLVLMAFNVVTLVCLAIYLAIFFPGSGADPLMVFLLVLALYIFAFNMANASRLLNFMHFASYGIWLIGLTINIGFMIMSMTNIGFGIK